MYTYHNHSIFANRPATFNIRVYNAPVTRSGVPQASAGIIGTLPSPPDSLYCRCAGDMKPLARAPLALGLRHHFGDTGDVNQVIVRSFRGVDAKRPDDLSRQSVYSGPVPLLRWDSHFKQVTEQKPDWLKAGATRF